MFVSWRCYGSKRLNISIVQNSTVNTSALKFDALVLKSQLGIIDERVNAASSERKIIDIAAYLKEKKASIPQVLAKMPILEEVISARFWETKTLHH